MLVKNEPIKTPKLQKAWNPDIIDFSSRFSILETYKLHDTSKTPSVFLKRGWRYKFVPVSTDWFVDSGYPSISSGIYITRFMHFRDGSQIGDVPLKCFPSQYNANYDDSGNIDDNISMRLIYFIPSFSSISL